jgi:hypothetical protein
VAVLEVVGGVGTVTVTIVGATSDMEAELDWDGSATLVAVTVTFWLAGMAGGAVYRPVFEIVPTAGLSDQLTDESEAPVTVAVNC